VPHIGGGGGGGGGGKGGAAQEGGHREGGAAPAAESRPDLAARGSAQTPGAQRHQVEPALVDGSAVCVRCVSDLCCVSFHVLIPPVLHPKHMQKQRLMQFCLSDGAAGLSSWTGSGERGKFWLQRTWV
jgi:hypothetical protein